MFRALPSISLVSALAPAGVASAQSSGGGSGAMPAMDDLMWLGIILCMALLALLLLRFLGADDEGAGA